MTTPTSSTEIRPLEAIVEDVLAVLEQTVWLPYVEDYAVLALTVPVSQGKPRPVFPFAMTRAG